jgi:hypothetical protein
MKCEQIGRIETKNSTRLGVTHKVTFLALSLALLTGCIAPIGARHATPGETLRQLQGSTLNDREPDGHALAALRRFDQEQIFNKSPDAALQVLHQKALETGERDLLFALAELNHLAAERLRRSVKPWEPRDARDYDLASACYAYLYLLEKEGVPKTDAFYDRFRQAGDLYYIGLVWALTERRATNSVAILAGGTRQLPCGQLELEFTRPGFPWDPKEFDRFLLADHYVVYGLSVRNRQRGLGAPLIGVSPVQETTQLSRTVPATVFLRLHGGLAELGSGRCRASLELYSGFGVTTLRVGDREVPIETDTTVPMAYALNQQSVEAGPSAIPFRSRAGSHGGLPHPTLRARPGAGGVRAWHIQQPGLVGRDDEYAARGPGAGGALPVLVLYL